MKKLSLNGTWHLRWSDGQRGRPEHLLLDSIVEPTRYLAAEVPGEVHLDLLRAGLLRDPYTGRGHLEARWVEEQWWSYRRTFEAPCEALAARAWLVFEGLDLVAAIYLNGEKIGAHANAFIPCRIEVTGKLRPGKNLLVVHLDAGLYAVADKPIGGMARTLDQNLHKRQWLRKPQCQFGWDWAPRLINVGISQSVELQWGDPPLRLVQFSPLVTLSEDLTHGHVRARVFLEGLAASPVEAELTAALENGGGCATATLSVAPGTHPYEVPLDVLHPTLWWPVGQGVPHLYNLKVTLRTGGQSVEEATARIGFRHVRVNQEAHPAGGRRFVFEINGRKVFCKGGNFVPADMILARLDRSRYDILTDLAIEANFNFLRVWGGGLYEAEAFYDLCNEKGILVWQEFIFACEKYPLTDEAFFDNAKAEAVYQIRRLARHPCLIAWCGNNEMEEANWWWGFDKGVVYPDYAFFHLVLPRLLREEDATRYYQPSSPYTPDQRDPRAEDAGDQHPWSIGFADTDFRKYRQMICRFANEGGILGPTALPTMRACFGEEAEGIHTFTFKQHDNGVDSWFEPSSPDRMLTQWTGKIIHDLSLEAFTYWGGLVQSEGLREYIDNFHRRMFDSSAAIFWMYNDTWPCTRSWTIVDYYLRRTPSFAAVKRAMAARNVVVVQEGAEVVVYGINETPASAALELQYGLFHLAGGYPVDDTIAVTLPPNASTPLARFPLHLWKDPMRTGAFAVLRQRGQMVARNRLFLPLMPEMVWPRPALTVRLEAGQAIFESPTFVWGVCLDLDGERPLPDNYFDVFPGMAYVLPWAEPSAPKVLYVGNLFPSAANKEADDAGDRRVS